MNFSSHLHSIYKTSIFKSFVSPFLKRGVTTTNLLPHQIAKQIYSKKILRGANRLPIPINEEDKISGFCCKEIKQVPELNITAYHFIHEETKAEYIHIDTPDITNFFSVVFRTPPINSTGLTHILEHLVLSGSKNYTVGGDVFTLMRKNSVNTYMNASTYCDRTAYPFATSVPTDFANLIAIYCDAVFHPNLNPIDFAQEGYRYSLVDNKNSQSDFQITGVVFNEMKEYLYHPENLIESKLAQKLYQKTPYAFTFGGDPDQIPELTLEVLKDYWKSHYHPSNCLFYTSGDISPLFHMEYLGDYILPSFKFNPESYKISVNRVKRWRNERNEWMSCPLDPLLVDRERELQFCRASLTNDASDQYSCNIMHLLSLLLLQGPSTPFYKTLVETNKVKDIANNSGANDDFLESSFRIFLTGITEKQLQDVENTIKLTLKKVVKKGFNPQQIESALNRIELDSRTIQSFNENIYSQMSKFWTHRLDIFSPLQQFEVLNKIRQDLSKPNSKILSKYVYCELLQNNHTLNLTMVPDDNYYNQINSGEIKKCKKVRLLSSPEKIQKCIEINEKIESRHKIPPKRELLPRLKLKDISTTECPRDILTKKSITVKNIKIPLNIIHTQTNSIDYIKYIINCNSLPKDLYLYLPLYCQALGAMGTKDIPYDQFSMLQDLYSSGYLHNPYVRFNLDDNDKYNLSIFFSTNCLSKNLQPSMECYQKLIEKPSFDNLQRLKFLIDSSVIALSNSISDTSDQYTFSYCASKFGDQYQLKEQLDGYSQVKFSRELSCCSSSDEKQLKRIRDKLYEIHNHVFNSQDIELLCVNNNNQNDDKDIAKCMTELFTNLPMKTKADHYLTNQNKEIKHTNTFFGHNRPVCTTVRNMQCVSRSNPNYIILSLLGEIVNSNYLHREIRENQGAYGTSCSIRDGLFCMSSMSDPSPLLSIQKYESAMKWISEGKFTQEDMNDAKLVLIGTIDQQYVPQYKGLRELLYYETPELLEKQKQQIISATKEEILQSYKEVLEPNIKKSSHAVWGTKRNCPTYKALNWDVLEIST